MHKNGHFQSFLSLLKAKWIPKNQFYRYITFSKTRQSTASLYVLFISLHILYQIICGSFSMMDHQNMEKWETRAERKEEQKGGLGEVVSLQSKAMVWEEEEGVGNGCATRGKLQDAEGGWWRQSFGWVLLWVLLMTPARCGQWLKGHVN